MKKRVLISIFFILLISISFAIAQENETTNATTTISTNQVDSAYEYLQNEISEKGCSSISLEDQIFSLLAVGECGPDVISASVSDEYWQISSRPNLKITSQAILALDETSRDTTSAEEWLLSQTSSPSDIIWYLQIESTEETTCEITYNDNSYDVDINEDKTLSNDAGNCLELSSGDYWLEIDSGCFDYEFEINCDKSFQTNLIFKRRTSNIHHLLGQTNIGSASATTTEKVRASCFIEGGECDYEGSLWATLVLFKKGYDVDEYLPYLITLAEENIEYLPESFLYFLTGEDEYRNDLLLKQKKDQNSYYWDEGGLEDKFYDTALALLSISDEPLEETNTKTWLLSIQKSDGGFPTSIKNNAFILYSLWPRAITPTARDCEDAGHTCTSIASCDSANVLSDYSCGGALICCNVAPVLQSCSEMGGETCTSDQNCVGGRMETASDTSNCCVGGGTCESPSEASECEEWGGTCRVECESGEVSEIYECDEYGEICCMEKESSSLWWIWILLILIILAVVGIIFRKKIQSFFRKKPGLKPVRKPSPGMPPAMMRRPPIQRRILPPPARRAPSKSPKKPGELDDVLKKLKKLGK